MFRDGIEEIDGYRHEKRGRNALTRDVTDTEKEFLVADEEVEQVASDGLGGCQVSVDINIFALGVRREFLRHHRHLDIAGNPQLLLNGGFGGCSILQFLHILCQ